MKEPNKTERQQMNQPERQQANKGASRGEAKTTQRIDTKDCCRKANNQTK